MTRTPHEPGRPPAGPVASVYRVLVGLFYAGSAVFNLLVSYPNSRAVYAAFADLAWPGADWLVRAVIMPIAGPFTLAVVAFEMVTGLLLLGKGRRTRAGLWAALVWLIVLIPFLGVYAVANAAFILSLLPLLRSSHDRSLLEMIHARDRRDPWFSPHNRT